MGSQAWRINNLKSTIAKLDKTIIESKADVIECKGQIVLLERIAKDMIEAGVVAHNKAEEQRHLYESKLGKAKGIINGLSNWKASKGASDFEATKELLSSYRNSSN